jgi:DNA (cytosine-5)-methyltransferase 1
MTHASLFSGIGVFDKAAEDNGLQNIFQCEINDYCQEVLSERFPTTEKFRDIRELDGRKFKGKIDILTGGFPCQDISVANVGGKGLEGNRSGLWYEYLRIIRQTEPRFIVIENSPNLRSKGLNVVLYQLAESGYNAEWDMLQASFLNGHHKRQRLIVIAYARSIGLYEGEVFGSIRGKLYAERQATFSNVLYKNRRDLFERITKDLRKSDGTPNRLDKIGQERIHALGNAIYYPIADIIIKTIKELANDKG